MNVIKQFPETLDKKTAYRMMKSPEVKKMVDAAGSILEIKSWMIFTDTNYSVLTVETVDGEMFGTISESFMKAFEEITTFFGDDVGAIKVIARQSKAGRTYLTCDPV